MCTPSCYVECSRHRKCKVCAQTSGDIGFAPTIVFGRSLHSPSDNCVQIVWKEIKKNLPFNRDISNIIKLFTYRDDYMNNYYTLERKHKEDQKRHALGKCTISIFRDAEVKQPSRIPILQKKYKNLPKKILKNQTNKKWKYKNQTNEKWKCKNKMKRKPKLRINQPR